MFLSAFGATVADRAYSQDQPIGDLYAPPLVLISRDSPDHPNLLNQAEALDINGDGRDDAVFSGQNQEDPEADTPIYLMTATETGTLAMSTSDLIEGGIPVTERGFRQAIPADFNGDGRLDLFLESHGGEPDCGDGTVECWTGGANALLLSNAEGKLVNVTATHLPAHTSFTHGSSLLDYDGDNDLDIWVNNLAGSPLYDPEFSYLLENNGAGVFSVAADASNPWQTPIVGRNGILPEGDNLIGAWSFAVDAENDGDMDLGLGWISNFGRNVVLLDDGTGSFVMPASDSYPSPETHVGGDIQHALVHDVDGDGLDDVLLHQIRRDFSQPRLQVLISNGDGTFRDETQTRYPSEPLSQLSDFQLHDLDNDGHLDLFSNVNFARADIRLNDGEGFFRPLAEDWLTGLSYNWIVLDVDGDGGTDFLANEWYGLTLHKMSAPYGPNLDGTASSDRLIGGAVDNVFNGFDGDDRLDGGLGNDTLHGGPGSDELIGGKGDDVYVLELADLAGTDLIFDKLGEDTIEFRDFDVREVASVSETPKGDLVLGFVGGLELTVQGHFANADHRVEWVQAGDCLAPIGQPAVTTSADVEVALAECLVTGTIFGSVTDADSGAPVHPVWIWLWDPATQSPVEGSGVGNNPDGSFLMDSVPEGSYKVFFDAYGPASGYVDELYADASCQPCDFSVTGDVLAVSDATYEINMDLVREPMLSGQVTGEGGAPLEGVRVDLFDASGAFLYNANLTTAAGDWYMPVPGPGTYYVRTAPETVLGYQPEVWDDMVCEDCDVTVSGTPIEVTDGDIAGIDFALQPPPAGTCGANDLITAGSFEDLPAYSIRFVTDASTVFTQAGQQFTFEIEYVDEQGMPVDAAGVEWCLQGDVPVAITPDALSATVESTGFSVGSAELFIRDAATAARAKATIMFADLTPEGVYIDSAWVIDTGAAQVTLVRNATTEALQVGDVLVSGDLAGLLVRVLGVSLQADRVVLDVEAAIITDAFANLDVSASVEGQTVNGFYDAKTGELAWQALSPSGKFAASRFSLGGIECKAEDESPQLITLEDGTLDWELNIELDGTLRIENSTVEDFSFFAISTLDLIANTGSLSIATGLAGKVTCDLPIPAYDTPSLPLSVFSFGLGVQPKVGVELTGSVNGPSFSLAGPNATLTTRTTKGIGYTPVGGWAPISAVQRTAQGQLFEAEFSTDIEFNLGTKAFAGAGMQLVADLGRDPFSLEIARVEFVELIGDVTLTGQLTSPFDPMLAGYTGPKWDVSANVNGDFKAELTGGGLQTLLEKLDLPVTLDIGGPIFDPIKVPLVNSPKPGSVSLNCQPTNCYLDPMEGGHASIIVMTDGERSGQVEFLASIDGEETLATLTSSELFLSSALGQWSPMLLDRPGVYRAHVRIETDALSSILPYTLPTDGSHEFTVGATYPVSVEKINAADGMPTAGGLVVSNPAGINCGETCEGFFPVGAQVELTASTSEGFEFVRWADDSPVCAGSISQTCAFTAEAATTAKAIFQAQLQLPVLAMHNPGGGGLELHRLNTSTGASEKIADVAAFSLNSLEADPALDRAYYNLSNSLVTIDLVTGAESGTLNVGSDTVFCCNFELLSPGELLGIGYDSVSMQNLIIRTDVTTGSSSQLNAFTFDSGAYRPGSVVADPANNRLYAMSSAGSLYTFDTETGNLQDVKALGRDDFRDFGLRSDGKLLSISALSTAPGGPFQYQISEIDVSTGTPTVINDFFTDSDVQTGAFTVDPRLDTVTVGGRQTGTIYTLDAFTGEILDTKASGLNISDLEGF